MFEKSIKLLFGFFLIIGCFILADSELIHAATKIDKPVIKIEGTGNDKEIQITIAKCKDVDGFLIYMKSDTDSKYKKIKKLKKDGNITRSYIVKNLSDGTYSFKVKAYRVEGSKTIKSKYSKAKKGSIALGKYISENSVLIDNNNFPDDIFRYWVLENCDTDKDGILSQNEREYRFDFNLSYMDIKDLTGIGYFMNLYTLDCSENQIEFLDLSKNISLGYVNCSNNKLTDLDISQNISLTWLNCSNNELIDLDVSNNKDLIKLYVDDNKLKNIDVKNNINLKELMCVGNQLISIDIGNNTSLVRVHCEENQLENIVVGKNTNLEEFCCNKNKLKSLDVSENLKLSHLDCSENQLTSLNVSKDTALKDLSFYSNQLQDIDISDNTNLENLTIAFNPMMDIDTSKIIALKSLSADVNQLNSMDISKFDCSIYCARTNGVEKIK